MLKKIFAKLSVLSLLSASLCAAEFTEVFRIDGASTPGAETNIVKTADGLEFNEKSSWTQPVTFNPSDAEIELNAVFNLSPVTPNVKRKYNYVCLFTDAAGKQVAGLLILQYPTRKNLLINFTAFNTNGKPVVCERSYPFPLGTGHTIKVQMTKDAFILSIDGKVVSKRTHNATFAVPVNARIGSFGGNRPSAIMTLKNLSIKSK